MKHRGVRVVKEVLEKEIAFLVDVDPRFVSLVRHGANQQPFRVIKSEKGGDIVGLIVQSILLPDGVTLEQLAQKKDLAWLTEVNTEETSEHGGYSKVIQKAEDEFETGSLNLVKLDDSGAFAMVGKLLKPDPAKDVLSLGVREADKILDIPRNPMETAIAEEPRPSFVITFGEMFHKELSSFIDVVRGVLSQSGSDPKKRKKTVLDAADAFKGFLVIAMDALGTETAKVDAGTQTEQEENPMFKDKDEFTAAVTEILESTVPGLVATTLKSLEEDKTEEVVGETTEEVVEQTAEETPNPVEDLTKKVQELTETVSGLATKTEGLASQLVTDPGSQEVTEEETVVEKTEEAEEDDKSVFRGILFKRAI